MWFGLKAIHQWKGLCTRLTCLLYFSSLSIIFPKREMAMLSKEERILSSRPSNPIQRRVKRGHQLPLCSFPTGSKTDWHFSLKPISNDAQIIDTKKKLSIKGNFSTICERKNKCFTPQHLVRGDIRVFGLHQNPDKTPTKDWHHLWVWSG